MKQTYELWAGRILAGLLLTGIILVANYYIYHPVNPVDRLAQQIVERVWLKSLPENAECFERKSGERVK